MSTVAREWNQVEKSRRARRQRVLRWKEKQRLADTNKWSARNSSRAKKQLVVKQALRDWFEAARDGPNGVSRAELVDAVITLGLNDDHKHVKRTISAEADAPNGQLLSLKSFTAALLACCASDRDKERLFRALRGEGGWKRFRGGRSRSTETSTAPPIAAMDTAAPSGVPAFITMLTAYRRKVLLATVAQKYPTPCTSSFWTPDNERRRDTPETIPGVEAIGQVDSQESDYRALRGHVGRSSGDGDDGELGQMAPATPIPESLVERGTSPAQQVSKEVQRRYDAITLYLAEKAAAEAEVEEVVGDRKVPLKLKQRPRTTPAPEGGVRVTAAGDNSAHGLVTPERFRGGHQRPGGRPRTTSPTGQCSIDSTRGERGQRANFGTSHEEEIIHDTALRLRDSLNIKELNTNKLEARWDNYQVMKRRWRRRTPLSILKDDGLDEEDRSYSRLSRPGTTEERGFLDRRNFAKGGSATSFCRRPNSAPAGNLFEGPSSQLVMRTAARSKSTMYNSNDGTYIDHITMPNGNSSEISDSDKWKSGSRSRRWQKKPLALGPIPLDEGQNLRYPLLQLSKERSGVASARKISRSYVDIPLARDSAGRWQPRLVRVPCSQP